MCCNTQGRCHDQDPFNDTQLIAILRSVDKLESSQGPRDLTCTENTVNGSICSVAISSVSAQEKHHQRLFRGYMGSCRFPVVTGLTSQARASLAH